MNWDLFSITNDGIRQTERLFETLVPDYVQIDSREIPDLVKFVHELSKTLHYYNVNNKADGNWSDFFSTDANILIILISRFDLNGTAYEFGQRRQAIINSETDREAGLKVIELIKFLLHIAVRMLNLLEEFKATSNYNDVEAFVSVMDGVEDEKKFLEAALQEAEIKFGSEQKKIVDPRLEELFKTYREIFILKSSYRDQIISSLSIFIKIFDKLFAKLNFIARSCASYVKEQHFLDKKYAPQVGLFIAFLDLYMHLKKRINGLNKSHLDFYYQRLLGIEKKESSPNYVHLVIEPDEQTTLLKITRDKLLQAEIKGEDPIFYQLENSLTLSSAKIKEVKTIYVSNFPQIISTSKKYRDVSEIQLYKAAHSLLKPAEIIKKQGSLSTFAIMGEDQHELADSERTMETAEPGFAIASPILYQQDGERTFSITLFLKSAIISGLSDYINNYAAVTNKSVERVTHELFSQAFILKYTDPEGWTNITKYSVESANINNPVFEIKISFVLGTTDKPFETYKEEIHGLGFNTELPVLQILLNNFVEHHPYSYLKNLLIERITLNAKVKGFKLLKLQNNVGPLSPANPFQPFGPQPSVGSFLDIKNTNVFNKYTKKFSIRLEWLELPREKGGFENYYAGYGREIKNESFQVEISSYTGTSVRSNSIERQKLNLFTLNRKTGVLNHYQVLKNIDFRKMEFRNKPTLDAELLNTDTYFREGTVRLELCSPSEAFGHRLFPQVFPEVILNNSKRFKKKLPVPNQPYIPLIKSIEVDFETEFSENFKEENSSEKTFQLFHIHPFGYHSIFPGNEKKNYPLLPQFPDVGNLMLGLDNIEKGSELSLFFQLQEKSFHHTLHEPEKVKWSYLDNNQWIPFREKDILSDTTGNFISSGIVRLRIPNQIPVNHSILKDGLFWLRASTEHDDSTQARIITLAVNGVSAVQLKGINGVGYSETNLLAGSIKAFAQNVKGVQNVWQMFSSFGGKPAESENKYYVRVSERLRHKNRPVQVRDIIQVILEEFPQILMAKCYSSKDEELMVVPGVNLHIVLIPRESESGSFISEQPRVSLSLLYKVKTYISQFMSPFVNIEVGNALYERVKVICKVVFEEDAGQDYGTLARRFINDINQYIAPWLFGEGNEIKIGGKIYKSELLMYLKNQPYVKYITGFSVVHFSSRKDILSNEILHMVSDTAVNNYDYIEGSSPASVLIPSNHHSVSIETEAQYIEPSTSGVGSFFVGDEFLVSDSQRISKPKDKDPGDDELFTLIITHNI